MSGYRILGVVAILSIGCGIRSSEFGAGDDGNEEGGNGGAGAEGFNPGEGGAGGITDPPCSNDAAMDGDADGWTGAQGDCNDCTEWMNPGAYDYAGNQIDEDCNGGKDNTPAACDSGLQVASTAAADAAKAVGLCQNVTGQAWGLISAEYVNVDGTPGTSPMFHDGHGLLSHFGAEVNPQEGGVMLAVSSGTARNPTDPGYMPVSGHDKAYTTGPAPGFPVESPSCPNTVFTGEAHDSIALRMRIKTPTNARALVFNVNFYTYEFPVYICSQFNDFVTAMLTPRPDGQATGNISFDSQDNPLSVNAGFLEVCTPQTAGGKQFDCMLGPSQLNGTGFEGAAATGWLQTTSPIADPGMEITLEFGAWDAGDGVLDTTGLFDNFHWEFEETPTGTEHIPDPK